MPCNRRICEKIVPVYSFKSSDGENGSKVPAAERESKTFVSGLEGKEYESPLKEVFASTILGDRGFIEDVKKNFVKITETDKDIPATKVFIEEASIIRVTEKADTPLVVVGLNPPTNLYAIPE